MSTVPVPKTPATPAGDANGVQTEPLEQRFRRLESVWTAETGHLSSTTKITNHPAFREIASLGEAVVPFMLRDLQERPRLWVWALPEITGANPVAARDAGNIGKMSESWLRWAKDHGYRLHDLEGVEYGKVVHVMTRSDSNRSIANEQVQT